MQPQVQATSPQLVCSKGRRDSNENEQPKRLILNAHVDLLLNSENYKKCWPLPPPPSALNYSIHVGQAQPAPGQTTKPPLVCTSHAHTPGTCFMFPSFGYKNITREERGKTSRIAVLRLQTGGGHQTPLGPASFQGFPTHKISWTIFFKILLLTHTYWLEGFILFDLFLLLDERKTFRERERETERVQAVPFKEKQI